MCQFGDDFGIHWVKRETSKLLGNTEFFPHKSRTSESGHYIGLFDAKKLDKNISPTCDSLKCTLTNPTKESNGQ
jgi:hypothetical protein